MMNLERYLDKILNGETINYDEFKKKLPKDVLIDHRDIFTPTMMAPKKHQVEVIDQERFYRLMKEASKSFDNRANAAVAGDSHKAATSFSHLLVFHDKLPDTRPDVVVIDGDKVAQAFEPKKKLLIIENEENFFRYRELLPLLSHFYGESLQLSCTDIVYGAGNQANKGLNLSFFGQYHNVLCAFDWDLGGLRMYKTLSSKLGNRVEYLLPGDFSPWQEFFTCRPGSMQKWLSAIELAGALGFTGLAGAFKSTSCFLEQESWLKATGEC